jgi:subtilisin-like proprotein convertase family protein
MNTPKFLAAFVALTVCAGRIAVADVFSFTSLNLSISDGQPAGISDEETISSSISRIGSVQVGLNIAGNFNGDLYCDLRYNNTLSVLLSRPGRTAGDSFGYADSGFNITLSDSATNGNIHTYELVLTPVAGSPLTGVWQPDGRTTSPATVVDTDPSTTSLSLFDGMNPSGNWTLFIADMSRGGDSTLVGWQLTIEPVPEPSVAAFLGLGAVAAFIRRGRDKSRRANHPTNRSKAPC